MKVCGNPLVKAKYGVQNGIRRVKMKQNDSPVWKYLLKIMHFYLLGRITGVSGGRETGFLHDAWHVNVPLCETFLPLFEICFRQECTVREMSDKGMEFDL